LRAGVSPSTVSNYLNKSAPVNLNTAKRIAGAIDKLRYTPDNIARGLRIGKTKTIGLILPDISNPFYSVLVNGMEEIATKNDYTIVLACNNYDYDREKRQVNNLVNNHISGFIFGTGGIDINEIKKIQKRGIPVVVVDRKIADKKVPSVEVDNFKAVYDGIKYLVDNGHKNIYYFTEPITMGTLKDRLNGYREALIDSGIGVNEAKVMINKEFQTKKTQMGYMIMSRLLSKIKIPAAVFATSDLIAFGAMRASLEFGFKVPDEISFLGYDNIFLSEFMNPPLTTIKQPKKNMGRVAMQLLIDLIMDKKVKQKRILLNTKLIERATVKKLI